MKRVLLSLAALSADACAVTRVTDLATNASGSIVHVTGARVRTLGINAMWVEENLEWECLRQPDGRLACRSQLANLPAP